MEVQEQVQREYYSTSRGLVLHPNSGKSVMQNGQLSSERQGEKIIQFHEFGDFGRYVTSDPEEIAFLDTQIARGRSDIMTPDVYNDKITPDEIKISALRRAYSDSERRISEQNKLIQELQQKLQRQGK